MFNPHLNICTFMEIFDDFISDKPISEAAWKGKLSGVHNVCSGRYQSDKQCEGEGCIVCCTHNMPPHSHLVIVSN